MVVMESRMWVPSRIPVNDVRLGRTPLSYAAANGSEEKVNLLLQREEVNPESRNNFGRTPLSYAAESRSEGAVELLLERGEVNPESRDNSGRTPLSHAAGAYRGGGGS